MDIIFTKIIKKSITKIKNSTRDTYKNMTDMRSRTKFSSVVFGSFLASHKALNTHISPSCPWL